MHETIRAMDMVDREVDRIAAGLIRRGVPYYEALKRARRQVEERRQTEAQEESPLRKMMQTMNGGAN